MATFNFTLPVQSPEEMGIFSTALGASGNAPLTAADLGKAVKLSAANTYGVCATTNELEGILDSVSAETVNSGYGFGGVQRRGYALAYVGANQGGTAMAVGDLVTADTQAAVGTANTIQGPAVKTGTPASFKWRCIRHVTGTGVAGDTVLIERV
jgi:hypothetical protein